MSRKNIELKKIRKAVRMSELDAYSYFWRTIEESDFWTRLKIIFAILKHPRKKSENRLTKKK